MNFIDYPWEVVNRRAKSDILNQKGNLRDSKELGLLVKGIPRDLSTEQFYNNPKILNVIKSILLEREKS